MSSLRPLVIAIVFVAALAYLLGIIYIGQVNLKHDPGVKISPFVILIITVIGGVLATHFGAVFGLCQSSGKPREQVPGPLSVHVWARVEGQENQPPQPVLNWLQVAAAYFYFFSLILAAVYWGLDGFSEVSHEVLRNMSSTLLGVAGGILAIVLNFRKQP